MDVILPPPPPISRHIPVDVCENIIDQLYSAFNVSEQVEYVSALRRCALECKDWRVRSQMRLFVSVILHDIAALHKIAALPRLNMLRTRRVGGEETWYPRASQSGTGKPLQYLPLHCRFSLLPSPFTTITRLHMEWVTFYCFSDFLQGVSCVGEGVLCVTLGPLPAYYAARTDKSRAPAAHFSTKPPVLAPTLIPTRRGTLDPDHHHLQ
ncbi:hypothetical protein BD309DRAFT_994290 [Dichomitus squalens]|uniref:Uncharacterized protein n=1 Tax=Dichomitus squalens TaxID=114155 RepID=A0A4Q9PGL9_9APHY|nr:hypothetical protein BD309DRAFT_994290 [Dichomitus squalens]TBU51676.1 hypothetical protein BD310DRAFT_953141 [Dichomitus squalens]